MSPVRQDELLKKIGQAILREAPEGWERLVYQRKSVVDHSSASLTVEPGEGEAYRISSPKSVIPMFDELRSGMYQEGKGTWFSVTYVISRPGRFKADYNYDEDPRIPFPTAWGFTNDLEEFPRDPDHIPEWLHEELRAEAEGRAME
ncbi:hypothetical protein [Nocardiopsis dassonvillei]|uniref:hypothetical protein n=1 Tax=Nocardiopsis dassonvillei TaxID=2014 RepID=UPI003F5564C5